MLSKLSDNTEMEFIGDCDEMLNQNGMTAPNIPPSSNRIGRKKRDTQTEEGEQQNTMRDTKGPTRVTGAAASPIEGSGGDFPDNSRYPWMCSVRSRGFRGNHRCGATLLSGPPKQTILVTAAHCNLVCKEGDRILEICCCRKAEAGSCKATSSYCGKNPILTWAEPIDLQVVCGEWSLQIIPESLNPETEVVLNVTKITNHPKFVPDNGPVAGYDIAVYEVDDGPLRNKMQADNVWPACLPRKEYQSNKGIFSGWRDPEPTFRLQYFNAFREEVDLKEYTRSNLLPRQVLMEKIECEDPTWMNSNTSYPKGTTCYQDPSLMSCIQFGNSGSTVARPWLNDTSGGHQYSWTGALSMFKNCDSSWDLLSGASENLDAGRSSQRYSSSAFNPAIFTDGRCYLEWIADQYGMELGAEFALTEEEKDACNVALGDPEDKDKEVCLSFDTLNPLNPIKCDFDYALPGQNKTDECFQLTQEGYSYITYFCFAKNGDFNPTTNEPLYSAFPCANNCKGVDPNAVVIGGAAIGFTTALSGIGTLSAPVAGALGLGAGGFGAMAMEGMMRRCTGPRMCPTRSGQCCPIVRAGRRFICPRRC